MPENGDTPDTPHNRAARRQAERAAERSAELQTCSAELNALLARYGARLDIVRQERVANGQLQTMYLVNIADAAP